jgi:hypothetical protein
MERIFNCTCGIEIKIIRQIKSGHFGKLGFKRNEFWNSIFIHIFLFYFLTLNVMK